MSDKGNNLGKYRPSQDQRWKDFAYSINAVSESERASIMHSEGFEVSPVKKIALACIPPAIVIAAALLSPLPLSQAEPQQQQEVVTQETSGDGRITAEITRQGGSVPHDIMQVDESAQTPAVSDAFRSLWLDQTSYGDATYQSPYLIATHGGGLCATTAALDMLLEQEWSPVQVAEAMSRWADEHGGLKYCIDRGTKYSDWELTVEGAYDVKIEKLNNSDDIFRCLAEGVPVVACGEGNVFKSAAGELYSDEARLICFYRTDGDSAWAKDSNHERGGGDIAYSREEMRAFADSAAGKIFSISR